MSDRELLELAAKAAGIGPVIGFAAQAGELMIGPRSNIRYWNPLANDSTAMRLAEQLDVFGSRDDLLKFYSWMEDALVVIDDHAAAFRRAITCYAAEIGKKNPD
ncbi:hypothetical protein [Pseudomonas pseudonitroreducens]|uniref:hypothetical protein n=1 Tax=Pseudomonas pseudonitroreducens TaxID=2892326 RepID=UPI001F34ACB7|nr:hypothetical protein [Pseudomonas pseudonitroreducens]